MFKMAPDPPKEEDMRSVDDVENGEIPPPAAFATVHGSESDDEDWELQPDGPHELDFSNEDSEFSSDEELGEPNGAGTGEGEDSRHEQTQRGRYRVLIPFAPSTYEDEGEVPESSVLDAENGLATPEDPQELSNELAEV